MSWVQGGRQRARSGPALVVALALAVALTGCAGSDAGSAKAAAKPAASGSPTPTGPSVLQVAEDKCGEKLQYIVNDQMEGEAKVADFLTEGDDGATLTLSSSYSQGHRLGFMTPQVTYKTMMCLLNRTGAPDSVRSEVGQTTQLDGRQSAAWDDVRVTYSYVHGTGVSAVFTEG